MFIESPGKRLLEESLNMVWDHESFEYGNFSQPNDDSKKTKQYDAQRERIPTTKQHPQKRSS